MFRKIISFASILAIAANTTAFAHTAAIENSGDNTYKAVRLTPGIYNNANADLSDLLIKDADGEAVPYFINTGYRTMDKGNYHYAMRLINAYTKDDAFYFDYKIQQQPEHDVTATSINVATNNTNFAKNITLFGSYDNVHWEKVQDDTLYSAGAHKKLEVIFSTPQKYTHYRFKLANNLEKIAFSSADLAYNVTTVEQGCFIESIRPAFGTEEKEKQTLINIEGMKNLRLAEVTIETDSMFKRTAVLLNTSKEIYNLSLNGTSYRDTTLPASWQKTDKDILTVAINNNDDKPISVKGVIVKYYADELVFDGSKGKTFTLTFGDTTAAAPVYDIVSYKDEILKGGTDKLVVKAIKMDKTVAEESGYDYKVIFNIVIMVIAALLGLLILMKLRRKS